MIPLDQQDPPALLEAADIIQLNNIIHIVDVEALVVWYNTFMEDINRKSLHNLEVSQQAVLDLQYLVDDINQTLHSFDNTR
jgi:uncharacterized protein YoxC